MALLITAMLWGTSSALAQEDRLHAYGGDDCIERIDLVAVYYLTSEREPLPDWRERIEPMLRRCAAFHRREMTGRSTLEYRLLAEPFVSSATHGGLPQDDVNRFFWRLVNEVWESGVIEFREDCFPIVLVMADINFSPGYDDWTRVCDGEGCFLAPPHDDCAGHVTGSGEDRPGSRSGGARSVYWPERGIGLGLVTADGWRVPLKGSDCVVYHEGIGHAIGLPHPDPIDDSVMGMAQYRYFLNETWLNQDQKEAMGWRPQDLDYDNLFSQFSISHDPPAPRAGEAVTIQAHLPAGFEVERIQAEVQTDLWSLFRGLGEARVREMDEGGAIYEWDAPARGLDEGLAYRIRVETVCGQQEELWSYFKVREE